MQYCVLGYIGHYWEHKTISLQTMGVPVGTQVLCGFYTVNALHTSTSWACVIVFICRCYV